MNTRRSLPDEHPAWRVVGAWIAARQRGEPESILTDWVVAAARDAVRADVAIITRLGGAPLRTGAEMVVEARGMVAPDEVSGLQIITRGKSEGGEVVARLSIASLIDDGGVWRIAKLLSDDERRAVDDPAFARFLTTVNGRSQTSTTDGGDPGER